MAFNRSKMLQKFDRTDKARIKGRKKHTRTGACTCKLGRKCYHGKNYGAPVK